MKYEIFKVVFVIRLKFFWYLKEQKNICQSKNVRATLSNIFGQRKIALYHEEQCSKYISYITIVTKNVLFATVA